MQNSIIAGRQIRFNTGAYVRHMRTGRVYEIKHGPEIAKLENTSEPCYIFVRVKMFKEVVPETELRILRVLTASTMEKNYIKAPDVCYATIYGPEYPA